MSVTQWFFRLTAGLLACVILAGSVRADDKADLLAAFARAEQLKNEAKYEAAAAAYEKALDLASKVVGKDHENTAIILYNLAALYQTMGQYAKAEPLYLRSLAIREAKLGKDHPDTANTLNNLANLYRNMGQYAKAEPLYLRSLAIREAKLGKDHPDTALALNNLAALYKTMVQYAKAEPLYLRALAIREAEFGKDHPDTAVALDNLAILYREMVQYAKAEPLYLRSLAIREAKLGKDHPTTADTLNNLAALYYAMGQYAKAEPLYLRALAIYEAEFGKDHPDTTAALDNLAILYDSMGQYAKAEPLYLRALAIREAKLGKDHLTTADTLNNLAALYYATGQYAKAEPLYQRALAIREAKLGKDHPATAETLYNLGLLYRDMGQYAKAEPHCQRALAIDEAKLGKDHPTTAAALNNLAALYRSMGQYAKAEPLCQRALAIDEAKLGKDHPATADTLNNLAALYKSMGQYAKAEPLCQRALAIYEAKLGKDHPATADTLNALAALYYAMGQDAKAEPLYQRALAIREAKHGKDHPTAAESLYNLALLYYTMGQWDKASEYQDRLRRQVRGFVAATLPILSAKEQQQFLETKDETRFHVCLSHGLLRRDHTTDREMSAGWLLNGKAVAAQVQAESVQLGRESRDPRIGPLTRELVTTRQELASLTLQPPKEMDAAARSRKVSELSAKEQDLSRQLSLATGRPVDSKWIELTDVRRALPRDGVLVEIARFDRMNLQPKPGEKFSLGYRYAVWIIPPTGDITIIDLGDAGPIDDAVKAARVEFEAAAKTITNKGEVEAEKQLRRPMEALSKLVLEPLMPHIKGYKTWIVSPDGQLWLAPWAALPLADGSYAIEKHTIQYVVTGRDLLTPKNTKVTPTSSVVMADPDFDALPKAGGLAGLSCPGNIGEWKVSFAFAAGGVVKIIDATTGSEAGEGKWTQDGEKLTIQTSRAMFTGTLTNGKASGERVVGAARDRWAFQVPGGGGDAAENRGLSRDFKLGRILRLPGTAIEAEAILPRLTKYVGQEPRLFTENAARVEEFKNLKNPRVVILSTHGFFLEEEKIERKDRDDRALLMDDRKPAGPVSENPLLRCGLLLAGCNHAATALPGAETGVLTGLEIVGTDLRGTELVVLSACETGLGDVRNGEGVAGLRQAFQLAGAESVVATLWQVPDRDSALLMASFFEKLADKQARDTALADAQREAIQKRRDRFGSAHPYFWAAYTLTGQAK